MNDVERAELMMLLERQRARQRAEAEMARAARLREAELREERLLRHVSQQEGGLRALLFAAWR